MEHTKEPWALETSKVDGHTFSAISSPIEGEGYKGIAYLTLEPAEANARRIVSCVNAMQGITDPAAFVAAFEAMREAAERLQQAVSGDDGIVVSDEVDAALADHFRALTAARAAKGGTDND